MNRANDDAEGFRPQPAEGGLVEADALTIERACDRFEQAWQSGEPLDIEDVLAGLPQRLRPPALRELVAIEAERRKERGEAISQEEYRRRFPDLTQAAPETLPGGASSGSDHSFSLREPRPGERIGDYQIVSLIGSGGMGSVYKAHHQALDRFVAMKCLQPWHVARPEVAARFEREIKAAGKISHLNVVAVYDAFAEQGRTWLVTEYLEGADLQRLVRERGPLPVDEALALIEAAARGLEAAHQFGLVHRDVKPANLFLTRQGAVKVLDLGLSRALPTANEEEGGPLTASGAFLGTPAYMAPEQARSARDADARSDIYSLGCTLYFLVTGKPPFSGSPYDVLLASATEPVPELPTPDLPPERATSLQAIYRGMTAKSPDARFATMREVAGAIDAYLPPGRSRRKSAEDAHGSDGLDRRSGAPASPSREVASSEFAGRRSSSVSSLAPSIAAILAALLVAAAAVYGVYAWTRPTESPDPGPDVYATGAALFFDGTASYVEVPEFAVAPDRPATIEAVVRPRSVKVGNVVSWMGPDWMALYLSADGKWGVAKRVGEESLLWQAIEPATLDRTVRLAATWDGSRLRLYVDGVEVPAESVTFPLPSTGTGLFIGGVPPGRLPPDQADRYFDGIIDAVRLSRGARAIEPDGTAPAEWTADEATVALLRFDEGSGRTTRDEASGRTAAVHHAAWTTAR